MRPVQDTYPVYEANQVLSNLSLNQSAAYLEEQPRLTRANLVGIGIMCGMALRYDPGAANVRILRGCGVTSEGYLVVEPDDLTLVAWREYRLPDLADYPPLRLPGTTHPQYPLWEMFPAGEPGATAFADSPGFLDDKAVLLFLELKQEGLRNCSPNDCDDRGAQVTVTVRRLLVKSADLAAIIAAGAGLGAGLTAADVAAALSSRLALPDLKLPRYDVPAGAVGSSVQVLAGFLAVFRDKLAAGTGAALSAAYQAFRPLLAEAWPADPFAGFAARFGFLDEAPSTPSQVWFLQYYYDLFDDLFRAYDELRWMGIELLCACCPSEKLFPRHLMLGLVAPASVPDPDLYRQEFVPACHGEGAVGAFLQLFRRLVAMADSFTDTPPLPPSAGGPVDSQIRITPGAAAPRELGAAPIPYYYRLAPPTPLYTLWSLDATRRGRANQNPGYRADEYTPAAPPSVREPLRYDLAACDFFRVEGHLGKDWRSVLATLLWLREHYRLPLQVVALRTGAFDESVPVDGGRAHFDDLDAVYGALREALLGALCEVVRRLYAVPGHNDQPATTARLPLLAARAPGVVVAAGTVGAWCEAHLALFDNGSYIDIDQHKLDSAAVQLMLRQLLRGAGDLQDDFHKHVAVIYYAGMLAAAMQDKLEGLDYAAFENRCQDLLALTRYFRNAVSEQMPPDGLARLVADEDLVDQFDQVLYAVQAEPVRAVRDDYLRRLGELKQQQYLGPFLRQHPGIAHKAGVPVGGTFIVVYHDGPQPRQAGAAAGGVRAAAARRVDIGLVERATRRIGASRELALDPDVRALLGALGEEAGAGAGAGAGAAADTIIRKAVDQLAPGTVIADFYLPYLCCGGTAVQYVLPQPPLGVAVSLGCTNADGFAAATLVPQGGVAPFAWRLDEQAYQPLSGPVSLPQGLHMLAIRDSAGAESAAQPVSVPPVLRLGQESYIDDAGSMTWRVAVEVLGGVPPYNADSGGFDGKLYVSDPVPSGEALRVVVTDAAGCRASGEFRHELPGCDLPCDGFALRCGYRFWLPDPDRLRPYGANGVSAKVVSFRFAGPDGATIDLTDKLQQALNAPGDALNRDYDNVAAAWVKRINAAIEDATRSTDWLVFAYERGADGMPVLFIERFECLDFDLHVQAAYVRRERAERRDVVYGPKGTRFIDEGGSEITFPSFNCRRIAKCDPARPVTEFCKEVGIKLEISGGLNQMDLVLEARVSGPEPAVLLVWEAPECRPAFVIGPHATFAIVDNQPTVKTVRLSGFSRQGCMVLATRSFNVG